MRPKPVGAEGNSSRGVGQEGRRKRQTWLKLITAPSHLGGFLVNSQHPPNITESSSASGLDVISHQRRRNPFLSNVRGCLPLSWSSVSPRSRLAYPEQFGHCAPLGESIRAPAENQKPLNERQSGMGERWFANRQFTNTLFMQLGRGCLTQWRSPSL